METNTAGEVRLSRYKAWDLPTRLFHWINLLLVLLLVIIGGVMMFKSDFGISGLDAKIGLKTLHVWIGYAFAINLAFRLLWGLFGPIKARLGKLLPKKGELAGYRAALKKGENPQYLGHNPAGKLAVIALLGLLTLIMVTGLVRAGTDIFYPPLGGMVQEYIAADGVEPASLKPYDDTGVNPDKAAAIKGAKGLAGKVHVYSVYLLLLLVLLHIAAVIHAERKRQPGIISAMFSGNKYLPKTPVDKD